MSDEEKDSKPRFSRRTFFWLGGLGAAGIVGLRRVGCYPSDEWDGQVLARREAHTLAASAEALIPDTPGQWPETGPSPMEVARNVDAYLLGMPRTILREIRGMFALIEQGTFLNWRLRRFTRLPAERRLDVLANLSERGGMLALAFEGLRALVYVGWYQDERTWEALGYTGPMLESEGPIAVPAPDDAGPYASLVAEHGATPRGVL